MSKGLKCKCVKMINKIIDMKNNKFFQSGFTLVEVMAAVMVLSVGLIGSLTIINSNVKNISFEKNRLLAVSLAEDGLERARNIRDTNWLSGAASWDENYGFTASINKTKLSFFCDGSQMAAEGRNLTQSWNSTIDGSGCSAGKCTIYEYNNDSQFFCYSDDFGNNATNIVTGVTYNRVNPRTDMRRLITAEKLLAPERILIKVDVKWLEKGQNKYLTVSEILYNWK